MGYESSSLAGKSLVTEKPFIVVVTGCPGAGKTTLARQLSHQIHCPLFSRDEFKEGYVHTAGSDHASLDKNVNWRLYEIFFETVDFVISQGISIVIEAAFQHKLWSPKLTHLSQVAEVKIVLCTVDAQLAKARFIERRLTDSTRSYFHGDPAIDSNLNEINSLIDHYQSPRINLPTLEVNTTNGYNPTLEEIIAFAV